MVVRVLSLLFDDIFFKAFAGFGCLDGHADCCLVAVVVKLDGEGVDHLYL